MELAILLPTEQVAKKYGFFISIVPVYKPMDASMLAPDNDNEPNNEDEGML